MKQLRIRPESSSDIPGINSLLKAAFNEDSESLLVQQLRVTSEFIDEFSWVLESPNQLLGYLLLSPIDIQHDQSTIASLALAPMAVLPERQRQGLGGLLVNHAIEKAQSAEWGSIIVLGHPEYYPKFGFEVASKWGVTCPFEVPDEVFMAIELAPGSLSAGGKVVYPAPFTSL